MDRKHKNEVADYFRLARNRRIALMGALARKAIACYDLNVSRIRLHAYETNAIYRIDADSGRFVLRIATPGWRRHENLDAEAMWLRALEDRPEIRAPRIVPTKSSELVCLISHPDWDVSWTVTCMTWQPGRLLGHYLNGGNLKKMGRLFAGLHAHGASWSPPSSFPGHTFDAFLSRGEPDYLVEGKGLDALSRRDIDLIRGVSGLVTRAYGSLDRSDIRVIHCDLWHDNIKIYQGELYPFDFEDTILGFRIHDIAMAMLDLLDDTDDRRYCELYSAFRDGYSELLDWPAGNMDAMQAGRILWIINYLARVAPESLPGVMNCRRDSLESFVREGRIV